MKKPSKNPKILHRVYFNDMPPFADPFLHFRETWVREMPDYTIMDWNASNVDLTANEWVRRAAAAKSPVFLSEYFRWWALSKFGGVYLDADCEILDGSKLHQIIEDVFNSDTYDAATGVEEYFNGHPTAQTVISRPDSGLATFMMDMYNRVLSSAMWHWREERGLIGPQLMSLYFMDAGKVDTKGMFWQLDEAMTVGRVRVYPQEYFSPKFMIDGRDVKYTDNTCVYHLFANLNMEWSDSQKEKLRQRPMLFQEYLEFIKAAKQTEHNVRIGNIVQLANEADPGVGRTEVASVTYRSTVLAQNAWRLSNVLQDISNSKLFKKLHFLKKVADRLSRPVKVANMRVLHRIYFGFDGKPDPMLGYLETWTQQLPQYTIKNWNATNLPVNQNDLCRRMFKRKDHAFLTDYFRWWVLREYGGVYFDADVEVVNGVLFDKIITDLSGADDYDAIIGIDEKSGGWYTAHTMASKPRSAIATTMCEAYDGLGLVTDWWKKDFYLMAPQLTSLYFSSNGYNVDGMGTTPNLFDTVIKARVKIFPQEYFSPIAPASDAGGDNVIISGLSSQTSLCHHFACSWHGDASPYAARRDDFVQGRPMLLADLVDRQMASTSAKQFGAGATLPYAAHHPAIQSEIGVLTADGFVVDGTRAGTAIYGPYVDLPPGHYLARAYFVPMARKTGTAHIDVVWAAGYRRLAYLEIADVAGQGNYIEIPFTVAIALTGVEVRVIADIGFVATIQKVEFVAV